MAESLVFRAAVPDDLPVLVTLLADDPLGSRREEAAGAVPFPYRSALEAIDADPAHEILVAELDGAVVAMLQLSFLPHLTYRGRWRAQIEGVRVAREARGRGVGRALMERAVERGRARGCHLVQLTTDRRRPRARAFYEALGFEDSHHGMKLHLDGPGGVDPVGARLREIRAVRAELRSALDGVPDEAGAAHPEEGWSLQEVVEHLVLAERGGFDLIWKAAEAHRAGRPIWTGPSGNRGLSIEAIVARTWQPRETAPSSARPTGTGSLSLWLAHLSSCDALLAHLPGHLEGLPLDEVIHPHFLSGPLDALQRLDFIRFHMVHHGPQIRRVMAKLGL